MFVELFNPFCATYCAFYHIVLSFNPTLLPLFRLAFRNYRFFLSLNFVQNRYSRLDYQNAQFLGYFNFSFCPFALKIYILCKYTLTAKISIIMTFTLILVLISSFFFLSLLRDIKISLPGFADLLRSPLVSHVWRIIYQTHFTICHSLATRRSFLHV